MECLIKNTHKRLLECHRLWHQSMENYFDPEGFRVNLNALIQALRNLTFALQKERHAFKNFDTWYQNWQGIIKKDPILKWLNDARVEIVHQKDLEKISIARVTVFAYEEILKADIKIPIETCENMIALYLLEQRLINKEIIDNDFLLKIERRWIVESLPSYDVLGALAYCYGFMQKLVEDAHLELGININQCNVRDLLHKNYEVIYNSMGIPNCMTLSNSVRFKNLSLKSLITKEMEEKLIDFKESDIKVVKKRYKVDDKTFEFTKDKGDIKGFAKNIMNVAKKVLAKDGYHMPIYFLFDKDGNMQLNGAKIPEDKSDKFLLMEYIAEQVRKNNSTGIVFLTESWITTDIEAYRKGIPTEEHKGRKECIIIYVATKEGINDNLVTIFKRDKLGRIKFEETIESKTGETGALAPIFKIWKET